MSAATLKQISCLFVRLNITLLFTFVRSQGTEIYDAAITFPFFDFSELVVHFFLRLWERAAALLLSPFDYLFAKVGGTVSGGVYVPFILTVDQLGWLC